MMSVLRTPMLGRLGRTLSAQSRPMLLRMWQMRLPSGRGIHHGCTCHHMRAHAFSPCASDILSSARDKAMAPAPRLGPDITEHACEIVCQHRQQPKLLTLFLTVQIHMQELCLLVMWDCVSSTDSIIQGLCMMPAQRQPQCTFITHSFHQLCTVVSKLLWKGNPGYTQRMGDREELTPPSFVMICSASVLLDTSNLPYPLPTSQPLSSYHSKKRHSIAIMNSCARIHFLSGHFWYCLICMCMAEHIKVQGSNSPQWSTQIESSCSMLHKRCPCRNTWDDLIGELEGSRHMPALCCHPEATACAPCKGHSKKASDLTALPKCLSEL